MPRTEISAPVGAAGESPVDGVIRAVAAFDNSEPSALPPLYEAIDPDALNAFLQCPTGTHRSVEFEYAGCRITIDDDGELTVSDPP